MSDLRFTKRLSQAIQLAIETHWLDEHQYRKGKDVPYITHPLTVATILALADADEEIVIAGLLHDTIEDSTPQHPVTREMIAAKFGDRVAELVDSVTEQDKRQSWELRKREALTAIEHHSNDSLILKSADLIANVREIHGDYLQHGDSIFDNFNASKVTTLAHYRTAISVILRRTPHTPLSADLAEAIREIDEMLAGDLSSKD